MRNLFFWRGIEDAAFKPSEGGGFVFFPYGALSAGYIVTAEQKAELGAVMRRFYLLATIVILAQIVAGPALGILTALAVVAPLLVLLFLYFHFAMRARLAGAQRSTERLSIGEAQRIAVRTMSEGRVAIILLLGCVLFAASLIMLIVGLRSSDGELTLYGGLGTALFGVMFLGGCYTAWLKFGRR